MDPAIERELLSLCREVEQMLADPAEDCGAVQPDRLALEISKLHTTLGESLALDELQPLCRDFRTQMKQFMSAAKWRCKGLGECLELSQLNTLTHLCSLVIRMVEGLCAGLPRDETAHLAAAACEYATKASQASVDFKVRTTQNFVVGKLLEQIRTMQSALEDLSGEVASEETEQAKATVNEKVREWKAVAASWLPSSTQPHSIDEADAVITDCAKAADEVDFLVSQVLTTQVLTLGDNDQIDDEELEA